MKKVIGLAVATMAAGLVALPAAAQKGNDDMAPARLEALDAQAKAASFHIMHARAVEIAKANGLVSIREVELEHGSNWKVEGRDANGVKLEIELSGHDGKVLKVERD